MHLTAVFEFSLVLQGLTLGIVGLKFQDLGGCLMVFFFFLQFCLAFPSVSIFLYLNWLLDIVLCEINVKSFLIFLLDFLPVVY